MEQTLQGILPIGDTIVYTCPPDKVSKVSIRATCSVAYTFKVSKVSVAFANTVTMYDLTLDAGDTIVDGTMYTLYPGDQFKIQVDVATVNYTLTIMEY